jgi:peptidoglycan/LPS O-acetylase OafA/YrhL
MIQRIIAKIRPRLNRTPSGGPLILQIDGLRFVAISAVLLVHMIAYSFNQRGVSIVDLTDCRLRHYYEGFARGVELFFVISGFVIAAPFVRHYRMNGPAVDICEFYRRRLARLEPPFILAMLITYAALVLVHGAPAKALLAHLLATCTYSHGLIYHSKSTIAFISWSLEIEIQFYLLAPILLKLLSFQTMVVRSSLLLLAGLSLLLDRWLAATPALSRVTFFHYLPLFIAGILVSDAGIPGGCWPTGRHRAWDLLGACVFATAFCIPRSWTACALPFLLGLFVVCGFRGPLLSRLLSSAWFTCIGGMCYSIYLVHEPLIYFFGRFTSKVMISHSIGLYAPTQAFLLGMPVLGCSAVYFLLIEKPCMNRYWPHDLLLYLTKWLRAAKERLAQASAEVSAP